MNVRPGPQRPPEREPGSAAHYILTMSCPDTTGIVAAIAGFLAERNGLIKEAQHYDDPDANASFMRTVFQDNGAGLAPLATLREEFATTVASRFGMRFELNEAEKRCRVLIAVSRHGHCLNNLLHRWSTGSLPVDIVGVLSNHQDLRSLAEWHGVPYHYLPVIGGRKADQEERIRELYAKTDAELLVLARYMQILTPEACRHFEGRAINIHHSFLPGFKGARAYHQAYARGVKLIGATAHYVTTDLDEGPIIEQEVERVDHTLGPDDLADIGRDLESVVLTRAVRWHAERRVFMNGNKTVVLR